MRTESADQKAAITIRKGASSRHCAEKRAGKYHI
jgi:hypothetical protein